MYFDRRQVIKVGLGTLVASSISTHLAVGADDRASQLINEFTGGVQASVGKLTLTTPEIAENGFTVPISVMMDSAMEGDDLVEQIMILADGNPNPEVITFNFSALSGKAAAKTRIRLARTQNVIAIAKMSDGSFQSAMNEVKVTIGGCGA